MFQIAMAHIPFSSFFFVEYTVYKYSLESKEIQNTNPFKYLCQSNRGKLGRWAIYREVP